MAAMQNELTVLPFSGGERGTAFPVCDLSTPAAGVLPAPPVVGMPEADDAGFPGGEELDEYLPAPEDLLPVDRPAQGPEDERLVLDDPLSLVLTSSAPGEAAAQPHQAGGAFAVEPLVAPPVLSIGLPVRELEPTPVEIVVGAASPDVLPGVPSVAAPPELPVEPAVAEPPQAAASRVPSGAPARTAGFDDELARAGLAGLELELVHFAGRYLAVPFRVNSMFTVKGAGHAAPLLKKALLFERCLEHGIVPSREALGAVLKLYLAFSEHERIFSLLSLLPPPHRELAYLHALALHRAGRMDEALQAATEALDWYRPAGAVRYLLAAIHAEAGRHVRALEEARQASGFLATDKPFLRFYLQVARTAGDRAIEIDALQGLVALPSAAAQYREELAAALYRAERFEEAAPLYGELLETGDDHQEHALRYAICLAFTGGEDRAAELLTVLFGLEDGLELPELLLHLVERGVHEPCCNALIGAGLLRRGDVTACRSFLDSLDGDQCTPRLCLLKGECALLERQHEEALAILQGEAREWPAALAGERAFFTGVALHSLGRGPEAESFFREIPRGSARGPASCYYLGEIAYNAERYRESVELLRQARAGGYKKKQAVIRLAWAAFKAEMLLVALDAFREVLLIDPDFIAAYNNLGVIYARQGLLEEAAAILKDGLRRAPEDRELHLNLSLVYEQVLKHESREHYGRFLELRPAGSGERED